MEFFSFHENLKKNGLSNHVHQCLLGKIHSIDCRGSPYYSTPWKNNWKNATNLTVETSLSIFLKSYNMNCHEKVQSFGQVVDFSERPFIENCCKCLSVAD